MTSGRTIFRHIEKVYEHCRRAVDEETLADDITSLYENVRYDAARALRRLSKQWHAAALRMPRATIRAIGHDFAGSTRDCPSAAMTGLIY